MEKPDRYKGCATVWFGAVILWLFIFAHIFDDVRHGNENLLLGFGIPFWLIATVFSTWIVRFFWVRFPKLAPRRSGTVSSWWSVAIGLLIAFVISTFWNNSPLFDLFYDSCKIISLIVTTGLLLGFIYRVGGWYSVWMSLLSAILAADMAFLAYIVMGLLNGDKNLVAVTWLFAPIGLPYAIAVSLYDCYRRASVTNMQ